MVLTESNYETNRRGSIEVICGSMFSGKTEELIRRLKRAKKAGHRRALFRGEYRFA
jgi:thymidine kinase